MRDLMIDIETLGSRPGSVILSIGAVYFDAETGELGKEFYAAIKPSSCIEAGLTTDIDTMLWWMRQSTEAQDAAFSGDRFLAGALGEFGLFAVAGSPSRVWAKPPSFDLVLLESAMRACKLSPPWHFRAHRDCRTLFDITGVSQLTVGVAHNALDDAKAQAAGVIEAYRLLAHPEMPAWQPMDSAPTDGTIIKVVGRYKDATAGFPRYAGYREGEWLEYSRFDPQPLVCWAWQPREDWPQEGDQTTPPALQEQGVGS